MTNDPAVKQGTSRLHASFVAMSAIGPLRHSPHREVLSEIGG